MSPSTLENWRVDQIWEQMLQVLTKTTELTVEVKKLNTISLILGVSTLMLSLVIFIITLVRL